MMKKASAFAIRMGAFVKTKRIHPATTKKYCAARMVAMYSAEIPMIWRTTPCAYPIATPNMRRIKISRSNQLKPPNEGIVSSDDASCDLMHQHVATLATSAMMTHHHRG